MSDLQRRALADLHASGVGIETIAATLQLGVDEITAILRSTMDSVNPAPPPNDR